MKITNQLIQDIAALAKLKFDERAKKEMKADLKKIIGFVDKLSEVNTKGVEPLIYLSKEINVLRDDQVKEVLTQVEALKNAPDKDSDYFKISTVLKK